ncbi:MAG: hypothetical protein JJE55_12705 [Flavobacteriaceae bacterium]|nr:hypothetical protein [Flavobacteriaceae bacterium]
MDEKQLSLRPGDSLPKKDDVYRIALVTDRDKKNNLIPAVRCFSLSPQDKNQLSVDWNEKTTAEESVARFGATYKYKSTDFKPYVNREIYAIHIGFLHSFSDIDDVIFDPQIVDPPEKGKVSNPAHSLIIFSAALANDQAAEPEVLLKIRDHAKDKKIEMDWNEVDRLVIKLRNGE